MAKFVLGLLLGICATGFAIERTADGGLILTRDDVRQVETNFYQVNMQLEMAVDRIRELTVELENLKKSKCM
jgi:hypothetical protein